MPIGKPLPAIADRPLTIRTISDQLYYLIRDRILSGTLPDGDPIRQDTIATELGVSKIPLREALARLEQDGLVLSHPNRGFSVSTLSSAEAEEVFILRLQLEPPAAARGCRKATAADHSAARMALTRLRRAERHDDPDTGAYNRAFHLALIQPGAGTLTMSFVERINVLADRYIRFHLRSEDRYERAHIAHQALLETWLGGDADLVEQQVAQHIRDTMEDLYKDLP
ncbi:GntR family transcriptional regulator [Gluconacetobacter azotocaptans]|uniref:GntR family transcriptional regulator n=1 Tax=Gluconacetobacter azotocaptans TaxID=142834 RepID=A0A7W4PFI8_9PROT|nr:GntR family transcriptional regulator [Gluconacetobacter azotocaptans]MBB2191848.1 GntR family transcriptional regulator [Gluconacetobacter azotocaptans]MBM9403474.1 GntR family transcriptional regulator [Gluconacetobacter azotocaptans]GBQ33303.1 GntR family transcriptional regulator [Gluconacetobacter azotocaptans DSM 13594]